MIAKGGAHGATRREPAVNHAFNLLADTGLMRNGASRPRWQNMALETFAREYWLASSFLQGRSVPRPMSRPSAESCLRKLALGCRWGSLRRAASGSAAHHSVAPTGKDSCAEWLLPCDTEPETAP